MHASATTGLADLPSGTVTLLFTDIEGSTRLLQQLGDRYSAVLADHHRIVRDAVLSHGGHEVNTQGDSFFVAFSSPADAVSAASAAQLALGAHSWPTGAPVRVRMGVHTGQPTLTERSYVGLDVLRADRLTSAGHGGQVLVSASTRDAVGDRLPEHVRLRALGEHRLRDVPDAEDVFELVLPGPHFEFPPLRTIATPRHNLPRQTTPLVGRAAELAEARGYLLRAEVRLLSLTGPGGTGKTRLALQLAADVLEYFADGVWYVPLASIADAALVPSTIAQALGIVETAGQPPLQTLHEYLRDQDALLVLDNFEHLPTASSIVVELLASCPRLKVLVTSRAVLRIPGEHDLAVPPLDRDQAVRLFVERAQAAKGDFVLSAHNRAAVAEICDRLDGLPLGIELAAARVRLLPPEAMLARMERRLPLLTGGARDLPFRHQTLRGAVAWSFDLLAEPEQVLFRRLPVFAGGCTLDAAQAICGESLNGTLSDGVASLVDKSLLRRQPEGRLLMLETIREYGLEQLEASGESAELRQRHALFYVQLAEAAEPALHGPEQVRWLDRLEAEHDNIRLAHAWTQSTPGGAELGLRLASAVLWFCLVRGYFDEGRRALEAGLRAPGTVSSAVRLKALCAAGHLAQVQRDFVRSAAWLHEGLDYARAARDTRGTAVCLSLLGETERFQGDLPEASALFEESLALQRQIGDRWGSYHTLYRLAETALEQGDLERSRLLHAEGLTLRRAAGDTRGIAASLKCLGLLALARADYAEASAMLREAVATYRATQNKLGIANCLEGLASIALVQARATDAARLLGAVESVLEGVGGSLQWGGRARFERDRAAVRAALEAHDFDVARAEGRALNLDQAVAYALGELSSPSD